MAKKKGEPFEDALKRLQVLVERMEKGDLPLEEALESFTEGMRLAQYCNQKLEEAESRVQVLLQDQQAGIMTAPFDPASTNSSKD